MSNACDSHESSGFSAALMPPAAALECDRTGWTLLMIATVAPERAAASAARWPARPAPMINTSWEGMAMESIGGTGRDVPRAQGSAAVRHAAAPVILGDEHDPRPRPAPGPGARRRRPRRRPLPRARDPRGRGARRRVRRRGLQRRGGRRGARRRSSPTSSCSTPGCRASTASRPRGCCSPAGPACRSCSARRSSTTRSARAPRPPGSRRACPRTTSRRSRGWPLELADGRP